MNHFDSIVQKVQGLGFTAYEAKAYVTLLQHHPITGYELSKHSGVPRSAIYSVIHKLQELGAVSVQSSKPEKYIPLPPKRFLELLERQFNTRITSVKDNLQEFELQDVPDNLWTIVGYENMMLKSSELIQKAENSVFLSIWQREYRAIRDDLADAVKRGVEVIVYSFTEVDRIPGATYFSYDLSENELESFWGHKLILIADRRELFMGETDKLHKKKGVWTFNRALIDVAMNHLILDITIFGLRLDKNVRDTVSIMYNGEIDKLDKLMTEKYPEKRF